MCWLTKAGLGVLFIALFASCNKEGARVQRNKYYPVDSLLEAQVKELNKSGPRLLKTEKVNMTEKVSNVDSVSWKNELELFRQLDLNKPSSVDLYVSERAPESNSITYRKKPDTEAAMIYVRIHFDSAGQIESLEGQYKDQNALYLNDRYLRMEFSSEHRLAAYTLLGKQKMLFEDTVRYSLHARLEY